MIEFNDIHLSFGDQNVLAGFSARVSTGEKVLFAGESGTGKSSLLRMVLGFTLPTNGKVLVDGEELTPHRAWQIRRETSFVPQASELGSGTGEELLEMVFGMRHNARRGRDGKDEWLATLKLERSLLSKPMSDLSGGERQRVGLLTALLLDRSIFLLDEATASLDDTMKRTVVDLFARRPDWTVLAVSHDAVWRESGAFRVVNMPAPSTTTTASTGQDDV